MGVQQEAHGSRSAFPEGQLFLRQRPQNTVVHDDLPLHGPEAPLAPELAGDGSHDGVAMAGDDDLCAGFGSCQQAGKLRLGFVDVDDGDGGVLHAY